jgi:hypothetical protein
LPHFVAEFFLAFLIYVDLPPSAELFERHAAFAAKDFGHRAHRDQQCKASMNRPLIAGDFQAPMRCPAWLLVLSERFENAIVERWRGEKSAAREAQSANERPLVALPMPPSAIPSIEQVGESIIAEARNLMAQHPSAPDVAGVQSQRASKIDVNATRMKFVEQVPSIEEHAGRVRTFLSMRSRRLHAVSSPARADEPMRRNRMVFRKPAPGQRPA